MERTFSHAFLQLQDPARISVLQLVWIHLSWTDISDTSIGSSCVLQTRNSWPDCVGPLFRGRDKLLETESTHHWGQWLSTLEHLGRGTEIISGEENVLFLGKENYEENLLFRRKPCVQIENNSWWFTYWVSIRLSIYIQLTFSLFQQAWRQ